MLPTLPNIEVAELAVWPHDGTKVWWTVSTDYLCHFLYMSFPVHVISCIIAFIHAVWCVHSVSCCGMITCCWVFFTSVRHKRDCCVLQANSCHLQMKEHEPYLTPGLRKKRHLKLLTAQSDGDVPKYKLHIAVSSHLSSHTVPQFPLWQISTRPSYSFLPPTSRTSELLQAGTEGIQL